MKRTGVGDHHDDFVPFEEAEHTADMAITARGRDLRELALNACRGTLSLIADVEGLTAEEWAPLEAAAEEPERLLIRFLKALLLAWEMHGGLPVQVEIEESGAEDRALRGRVGFAHPPDLDERIRGLPKAATYHNMEIRRVDGLLEATVVLDV